MKNVVLWKTVMKSATKFAMKIEIRERPFDPWREVANHPHGSTARAGKHGATAVFVGTMRDFNEGQAVRSMTLEHYAGMTEKHLREIATRAEASWEILDGLIIHRVGQIEPGEPIVLVAVWSAHRAAAFEACRSMMEDLKSRAPFWKKEALADGERWVEKNTP